jgi:hypothetical protein
MDTIKRSAYQSQANPKENRRPIADAVPHGYQVILLLRRARCDANGRTAESINRLIEAQKSICRGIEQLGGAAQ